VQEHHDHLGAHGPEAPGEDPDADDMELGRADFTKQFRPKFTERKTLKGQL
jgi:hypothetical protein